ncbi:N-myristoyl transferase [Coprinopsis cinerea okayama7|uniref:Glycylpeptide N-tetradecanoyltransferase n=1 Tax=Coprinopsis cinerea (strain Okayama-7 / 130 / ATCC MYA-4618 / FGSC 9003) TaxID=240176 RepID=A8NF01_COPC7|nr:N-myristoyl transferase [Coprinopsis cinerea okayama7\|eukprot:XP_001833177.1 N-myristoyl transferase [Coprinopsis cinerea okayama7\
MSSQKQKEVVAIEEIIDTTIDSDEEGSNTGSEPEQDQPESSSAPAQKKSKKRSKASKILSKIKGDEDIPDEVVQTVAEKVKATGQVNAEELTPERIREALQQMKIMDVVKGKAGVGGKNQKDTGKHKFWSTQPVPQLGESPPEEDGCIEESKPASEIRQQPYPLPKEFEWSILDIQNPAEIKEVYDLLSGHYVEDDYAAFRFQYSAEFLKWALTPPGYHKEWHIGVRVASNKKLVAFISGVPMNLKVRDNVIPVSEINYLCVHKKLRSKRLAPVLIKEVTRQCNLKGIFQAIYTAGVVIPTPVSVCRYYHRSLNIPKLVDTKFTYVPRNSTLAGMIRQNQLPEKPSLLGLREMEEKDIGAVHDLFQRYMKRFDMIPLFDLEETRHQLLSGMGTGNLGDGGQGRRTGQVTWSYVVEDPTTHKITDFFSFYSLPSTIIGNAKYPLLEAAYLYYYASDSAFQPDADSSGSLQRRLTVLIGDALVVANNARFDVFNALTLMDNVPVLQDLKFGAGDGFLNFYLYNWRTSPLAGMNGEGTVSPGRGIGVVML